MKVYFLKHFKNCRGHLENLILRKTLKLTEIEKEINIIDLINKKYDLNVFTILFTFEKGPKHTYV